MKTKVNPPIFDLYGDGYVNEIISVNFTEFI